MNTENNKIIARFMGLTIITDTISYFDTSYNPLKKYNEDWNWLMEVVEKIESLEHCQVAIVKNWCRIEHAKHNSRVDSRDYSYVFSKIEAVYNACVEFVKWYSAQEK